MSPSKYWGACPLFSIGVVAHAADSRKLSGFFSHDISKIDVATITKLYTQMFHDESWKRVYFGVKKSTVKVTSHINIAGVGIFITVSAGFF